ncbi:MAG: PucR family transcriptional regulator ligand-binding domain-containing protein [Clostridium sp.]|nr:PucR family transcriptional regulator ligand-binding domain-containing protein [Clostridium sp.]
MKVTLDWFINNSSLNNLKCLSGNKYMNNEIESVNILDNPDVLKWIKKNELVLTTGYIFQDNPELQLNIIRELKEIGCAGLGIKIKRFFKSVPQNMIEEAERIGLPIIEMPFYYSFSDVSKIIYNEIYNRELMDIENESTIINKISQCYFENMGLDKMIKILSDFMNKTILLTDSNYNLLSIAIIKKHNYILNKNDISSFELSDFSQSVQTDSSDNSSGFYKRFSINDENFNFFIIMLPNLSGALCVLIEEELSSYYKNLLMKLINIIALEVEKLNINNKTINKQHNFFFDYLMSNEEKSESKIIELCNFYGFNYTKKRICINFILENLENEYHKKQMFKILQDSISQVIRVENDSFTCTNETMLCLFLFFNNKINSINCLNKVRSLLNLLKTKLDNSLTCGFKIAVSRCHEEISSINLSFKDTIDCLNLSNYLDENSKIFYYDDYLIYHILNKLSKAELKKIYNDTISSLAEHDVKNNTSLINILKTYFLCKFNSSETSQKLFIHRNTLLNKLDTIKTILNIDFNDYKKLNSLYIGICAYEILTKFH